MIWIRRTGWLFEHFAEIQQSREDIKRANADQVALFIKSQLSQGNKHTRRTLESSMDGLTRAEIRAAVDALTVESRLIERLLPKDERQGQRKSYLDIHCAENKKSTGAIVSKITQKDNSHD